MFVNNSSKNKIIDAIGLLTMGALCCCYVYFPKAFAEQHVQFPFLNFPVFIGEFVLLFCWGLFLLKLDFSKIKMKPWYYLIILYIVFLLCKAFYGNFVWGSLAFRHAALFYYPAFAIFGYSFFNPGFFNRKLRIALLCLMIALYLMNKIGGLWLFSFLCISLALISTFPKGYLKYGFLALVLIFTPYKYFFSTSRMMFLSNIVGFSYLILVLFPLIKIKNVIKLIFIILLGVFIFVGTHNAPDSYYIKSIVSVGHMMDTFHKYDKKVEVEIDEFVFPEMDEVRLYAPEHEKEPVVDGLNDIDQEKEKELTDVLYPLLAADIDENSGFDMENKLQSELSQSQQSISGNTTNEGDLHKNKRIKKKKVNRAQVACNNAVFRLFIWRDMFRDIIESKPLFGFDFGKPLRSKSLEILGWGKKAWGKDGWVAAHNSYFHMIYRSGIIGIIFLLSVFAGFLKIVIELFKRSAVGGLLFSGVIVCWFVAANFLLILELPYTAIPIWSLFGVLWGYYNHLVNQKEIDVKE